VYGLFRRWQRDGTWRTIVTARQGRADAAGLITGGCLGGFYGGTGAPACGRGPEKGDLQAEPPGGVAGGPADHGLGRFRGGLATKLHLGCAQRHKLLAIVITAGQRGDSPQFRAVLQAIRVPGPAPRTRPDRVLADKAYGSRANRAYLRQRGIRCTIPEKADQVRHRKAKGRSGGRPPASDPELYKARHAVECGSTGSSATAPWPPDTTSWPSATKPPHGPGTGGTAAARSVAAFGTVPSRPR
jgi:transposase